MTSHDHHAGPPGPAEQDPSDELFGSTRRTLPPYLRGRAPSGAPPQEPRLRGPQEEGSGEPWVIDLTDRLPNGSAPSEGRRNVEARTHDDADLGDLIGLLEKRIVEMDGRIDALPDLLEQRLAAVVTPLAAEIHRLAGLLANGGSTGSGATGEDLVPFERVLGGIPGIGPARLRALQDRFGSLGDLADASLPEVCQLPGIGADLAERIIASAWDATR